LEEPSGLLLSGAENSKRSDPEEDQENGLFTYFSIIFLEKVIASKETTRTRFIIDAAFSSSKTTRPSG
jgi:hypothetical protein